MSLSVRLFLGCLIAMASTSDAGAQFRMQRSSVPMRMNPRMNPIVMNPRMMNPRMLSARNPLTAVRPNLLGLARQRNLSRVLNPYGPFRMSNPYAAASSGYGGSGGGDGMNSGADSNTGDTSSGYSSGNGYMNPYANAYYNPYMPNPYAAASSGYGGSGGNGMNSGADSNTTIATGAAHDDQTSAYAGMQLDSLLTALGIPNTNGQFNWPLAFRLIPPGDDRDTLMQTESMVQLAIMQAAAGNATPAMLQKATRDVRKMRRWLQDHEDNMAEGTYQAGSAYLRRIDGALKLIGS